MFTVVLEQSCHNVLVESLVPSIAVVLELHILLCRLVLRTLYFHSSEHLQSTCIELAGAVESLNPVGEHILHVEALGVEVFHLVEIKFALQIAGAVLISLDALLELLLLTDNTDGIDTFVHSDGVLPVVGALCILGIILDSHCLVGTHVADHDLLLHATHLCTWGIVGIATLLDTI